MRPPILVLVTICSIIVTLCGSPAYADTDVEVATTTPAAATTSTSACGLRNDLNGTLCDVLDVASSILATNATKLSDSTMTISGMATLIENQNGQVEIQSNMSVRTQMFTDCPPLENGDSLSQSELMSRLTNPCRFDRFKRPYVIVNGQITDDPVVVYVRMYINVLQVGDASELQFRLQGTIQVRYNDPRLAFAAYSPQREQLIGDSQLRRDIWVPHIFLANEQTSNVLGTHEQDILTSIASDGTVVIASRVQANLYCWMYLRRFPFDDQECSSDMESWMYPTSEMVLRWEAESPVLIDANMHLTQYELQRGWTDESIIDTDLHDFVRGAFVGQYSSLSYTVHLVRQSGYWLLSYFLPSMIIVGVSWTAFWLQPDATPSRSTLGTTTMMTFVTLSVGQSNSLPRVSYVKYTEIWFLTCALFIGCSLIEFGFVNTIWRRNRPIKLRRIRGLDILKAAVTPKRNQKQEKPDITPPNAKVDKYLNIQYPPPVVITTDEPGTSDTEPVLKDDDPDTWATISPHDAALWVDRKARFAFPFAFLCFNIIFWSIVYFS